MASIARRIVSQGKRRFRDEDGTDLDLAYITDRIIIMGYPAQGVASLYRNSMKDVLRFLETRHGRRWHIYNFCPRAENSYDAEAVHDQVSRFPFPDHHAPPLNLIPLFVDSIRAFLDADPDNVAVIHCKAGKGRSGTMTCCYLLSLPTLPQPPQQSRNYSKGHLPLATASPASEAAETGATGRVTARTHALQDAENNRRLEALATHLVTGEDDEADPHSEGDATGDRADSVGAEASEGDQQTRSQVETAAAAAESADIAEKLRFVFQLHTNQRMRHPQAGKYGISIPSQRRWVAYYARYLNNDDPRPRAVPDVTGQIRTSMDGPRRKIKLKRIVVHMADKLKGIPPPLDSRRISVTISRYEDAYMADIDSREALLARRHTPEAGRQATESSAGWDDNMWKDTGNMFSFCGRLVQSTHNEASDALAEHGERILLPKEEDGIKQNEGIELDADRQILVKLLVGQTGSKHGLLPDVAALGYAWLIPSYEAEPSEQECVCELGPQDIDFLKPLAGLQRLQIYWTWDR